MKNKKWLLVIVLIVLVVNISFFVAVRLAGVDKLVQEKISTYIEQNFSARVEMGNFTFNDKQLKISELRVQNPTFQLHVKQLYVQYNLAQLLLSRFKNLHSIKHIEIYDPQLQLSLKPSKKAKSDKPFQIPDIAGFFKKLDIHNAAISVQYEADKFKINETWQNLKLSIKNTDISEISLRAGSAEQDSIQAKLVLNMGSVDKAALNIASLRIDQLDLPAISNLSYSLDFNGKYEDGDLTYDGAVSSIQVTAVNRNFTAAKIRFAGDDKQITGQFDNLILDNQPADADFLIEDLLSTERSIYAGLSAEVPLQDYLSSITGKAKTEIDISGKLSDPLVLAEIRSDSLNAYNQSITNAFIKARYQDKTAQIETIQADWLQNKITGNGYFLTSGKLALNLNSNDLNWSSGANEINADLSCELTYTDRLKLNLQLQDFAYRNKEIKLNDLQLNVQLADKDFIARLYDANEEIDLNLKGNLDPKTIQGKLELRRFDLAPVLSKIAFPMLSGEIEFQADETKLKVLSSVRAYDRDFGKLSGRLRSRINLDLVNERSMINLRTFNARYNYEDFSLELQAEGTLDSIHTTSFNLNNEVQVEAWLDLEPEMNYGLSIQAESFKIRDIAQYFMNYYTYSELTGSTTFDLEYDSRGAGKAKGYIALDQVTLGDFKKFNSEIFITGNNDRLAINNSYVCCDTTKLLDLSTDIVLQPSFQISAAGNLNQIDLEDIFAEQNISGQVEGRFKYSQRTNGRELSANFQAEKIRIDRNRFDEIKLVFQQQDSLLTINQLLINIDQQFDLNCSGAIGYNLLNSNSFPDTNTVKINYKGDLFAFLNRQTGFVQYGESNCEMEFAVGMGENGLSIDHGFLDLNKGSMVLQDQPNRIEDCQIKFSIADDKLAIDKFQFRMGKGKLYLTNQIMQNDSDFRLGMLDLGKFKLRTNRDGMQFYLPMYTPANTMINARISGRNSDHMEITGPFDDLKITGDILVFNGDLIYPPDTENLLKLFNRVTEQKKPDSDPVVLPLSFDLKFIVGENVRYMTYPVDIKVKPDGYLQLVYQDAEFKKPEALFIAEEGSVDMFGTTLLLDYLQINLTRLAGGAKISGVFYKKTADGSLITLEIFNDDTRDGSFGNLRFELKSDNPNDLITDILAKLRYNRTMDEISPAQRKTLLQDEVIQIAGLGLESAVLDPLISPVENTIRRFFRFDYFHLQTDLVQNLFASYSSEVKSDYAASEEQIQVDKFTSELFLNNLSISAGKYISRRVFLDYEARFQKQGEYLDDTNLGVYQDFTVRYDLPWKLRLSYRFSLLPFDEENEHQVGIERSFRF